MRGTILGLVLAVGAAGCDEQLIVNNVNSPNRERALARPTDVENLVAGQYRVIHNTYWSFSVLGAQMAVMGYENFSSLANNGVGVRSAIPRSLIDNSRGNATDFYGAFLSWSQAARAAAVGLSRLNRSDFTFYPASAAQTARARAFGYFAKGVALGYMALSFDSAAVITPDDVPEAPNALVGYDSLVKVALADLDSAIRIAQTMTALPNAAGQLTWIPSPTTLTGASNRTGTFQRLAFSFKARFRAGVARTPAERAAVDWTAVRIDADSGLASDFSITMANVSGGWFYNPLQMFLFQNWHQMWQGIMGMADTSGGYQTWLNLPRANKVPFLVVTNDRRIPAGTTRSAQQTAAGCLGASCLQPTATTPYPYFRNRSSGEDIPSGPLGDSYYDFYRFQSLHNGNRNGNVVQFPRAELDLLAAEAYLRAGDFASAMTRINITRSARGLPALAGIASLNDLIPGPACVPRVPTGPMSALAETPTATACGNIMEALKWEKRMETAFVSPGGWYFDGRGWGDLPGNTPLHYPVPYTELDARRQTIYNVPAVNGAAATTYTAAERLSNSTSNYGYGHY
jgi:hypothetical protein